VQSTRKSVVQPNAAHVSNVDATVPLRIAFFGLPLAAELLLRDGHDLVFAALCRRGCLGERRVLRAVSSKCVHLQPKNTAQLIRGVTAAAPELIVSWYWTQRIAPAILALAPGFGVHPSLLPRHRGADPTFWTIDAGDEVSGVTAHRLEAAYDTGAIVATEELRVAPGSTGWSLAKALDRPSLRVMRRVCKAFAADRRFEERVQDASLSTAAPTPDDAELELNWQWTSERLARRIRAASPYPGAFTYIGNDLLSITHAAVESIRGYEQLRPGELVIVDSRAKIRTGDGVLTISAGRLTGAGEGEELLQGEQLSSRLAYAASALPFT
jgi:methionyl-tRNA formyltransferase